MSFDTYWTVTPLVLIGLSGMGWAALWITPRHDRPAKAPDRAG
jgi:hypothetical protein